MNDSSINRRPTPGDDPHMRPILPHRLRYERELRSERLDHRAHEHAQEVLLPDRPRRPLGNRPQQLLATEPRSPITQRDGHG